MALLFLADIISGPVFTSAWLVFLIFSGWISKRIAALYLQLNKIVPEVSTLLNTAGWIENISFNAVYLQDLQGYFTGGGTPSSAAIKQLKTILDNFDLNLNMLFMILVNPFILWNLQTIFRLEQWRVAHKAKVPKWFSALAQMEAISTLATIHFNHPHWAFPVIDAQQHGTFRAAGLAHPLIAEDKCVRNDFSTLGLAQLALITGSNMAGKSTFLRSVGVNTVLAMTAA